MLLETLLEASHQLPPDALGPVVREVAATAGFFNVTVYLVDYDQRSLASLPPEDEVIDIDTTIAGRAYRQVEVLEAKADDPDAVRLWLPLLDGADRLGVLSLDLASDDGAARATARHLASLVGELVMSKSLYGDQLLLRKRRRPMDIAAEMRWSLLPPLTFMTPQVEVSGILEPAYEIAGDAFDYALNEGVMHVAVVDAMGHGLEASRIANLAVGTYRHARRHGLDLIDTFRSMDMTVAEQLGEERFVTGHLGRLDLSTGILSWANAGHPRPLLLRDATVVGELTAETCLPIGLGDIPTEIAETQLQPGDVVVFFTDGVVEARSPDGEEFGGRRLADHLTRAATSRELLPEMLRRLVHAIVDHEGHQLRDDATVLAVKWVGPPPGSPFHNAGSTTS